MNRLTYEELEKRVKELEKAQKDHHQIDNNLKNSEQTLDLMINTAPDIIYRLDSRGEIVFVNKAVSSLGFTPEELIGTSILDIVHPEDREQSVYRINERRCGDRSTKRYELRLLSKVKLSVPFEEKSIGIDEPVYLVDAEGFYDTVTAGEKSFQGTLGVARDITERVKVLETLRKSEERFRNIYNTSPLAFVIWDLECCITDWNEKAEKIFGWTKNEIVGQNFFEYIIPNSAELKVKDVVDSLIKGRMIHSINENLTKKGRIILCEWYNSLLYDSNGDVTGVISLALDVTEVKKAENDLKESRENLSVTLNSIGDGVLATDIKGCVTLMNPVAEKLSGWKLEEARGKQIHKIFKIVNTKTGKKAFNPVEHVLKEGVIAGLANHTELISKDGKRFQIADSAAPIKKDDGTIIGVILVFRDVTKEYEMAEKLNASLQKNTLHFDQTPLGLIEWDLDFKVVTWNPAAEEIFGFSEKESLGHHAMELMVPEKFRPHVNEIWSDLLNQKGGKRSTNENITKSGKTILCEWYNTSLIEKNGSVLGVASFVKDITESRKMEEKVAEQSSFLRQVIDINPHFIFAKDRQGRFTLVNQAVADAYGTTVKNLLGKSDADFNPNKEEVEHFLKNDLEVMDLKKEKNIPEEVITDSSGKRRWLHSIKRPIIDNEGNSNQILGVSSDITGHKQAEEELQRSEKKYRELTDSIPLGVFDINLIGDITFANNYSFRLFGYSLSDLQRGLKVSEIIAPIDRERALKNIQKRINNNIFQGTEYTALKKDGTEFPSLIYSILIRKDDKPAGLRGFVIDITDRKIAEEEKKNLEMQLYQSQKMESIGRLAGGIAHDFNNILTGIMGYAELLRLQFKDRNTTEGEAADIILTGAERASNLTKQLLGFARSGKYKLVPLNVNTVINETIKVSGKIFEKQIQLNCNYGKEINTVNADKNQLDQVFTNIFINAKDAMPGGGKLHIITENIFVSEDIANTRPELTSGEYVKISIADSGAGIPKDISDRIFEPFFTTKSEGEGTGLGLASAYGIIKNHDGCIYSESEPGAGTTFTIYLPVSNEKITEEKTDTEVVYGDSTILVIDDEADVLKTAKRTLEHLKYTVVTAKDGQEAVEVYISKKENIDLVLLDIIMPGKTGLETFRELKKIDPEIRVLLASGYSKDGQASEILSEGAFGFIQKPFSMMELSNAVAEALKKY